MAGSHGLLKNSEESLSRRVPVASDIDNDSSLFYEVSPLGTSGAGRTQELPCAVSRVPQEPLHIIYLLPSGSHPCEGSLESDLAERGECL